MGRSKKIAGALLGLMLAFLATGPAAHAKPSSAGQAKRCRIIIHCTVTPDGMYCIHTCL